MKLSKTGSRRQKIILYYTLAVVLPGIILGYLAYRGIRNDQALREKESLKRLELTSQAFFNEIDSGLIQFTNKNNSSQEFSGHKVADPYILALVVRDSVGSKKLITHQLLYLPVYMLPPRPELRRQSPGLKEGIRLEFAERQYPEAFRYYQDIVSKTKDPTEKIQALLASARLCNKLGQPDRAKDLYEMIRKDYSRSLLNEQIPMALTTSLEILKINRSMGEDVEMKENTVKYLDLLLHPPCEYTADQFDMFYQSFKEIIPGNDPLTDSLFLELDARRKRTDFLIRILNQPDIIISGRNDRSGTGRSGLSVTPINSAELDGTYLTWGNPDGKQTAMVIDFPVYLEYISHDLFKKVDKGSSVNIKVEDDNGTVIISNVPGDETISYLSFPFPENLPGWQLLLSENKPGFMATLFKTGSGIYLFVFILIALFMLLGFAFIMYTLNIELRLNKLKSEFISNVSHELKSPLTSIRMMTEMLHHNRVETEERKSAYYSAMLEESEHLSHLIDNILDFSRMDEDRKKYNFIDLDLNELIGKFLESTRDRIAESGLKVRYDYPDSVPLIRADRDAILQVIYNLFDNAIKFSGNSKQIDLSLMTGNNELVFCVKDYGIGIPLKDQEKIFDRFYRGDESQRMGIRGSGIGLTIVKKIVEDHGGHLVVASKPGEGSRFVVRLPLHGT